MKLRIFKDGPYWIAECAGVRIALAQHFWRVVDCCSWYLKRREILAKIERNRALLAEKSEGAQA
jgi:hypothetical protein